ncbi:MAG: putative esterase [Mycobacterium sp.]|nr:putative esterase [Mycobacterium sp.]
MAESISADTDNLAMADAMGAFNRILGFVLDEVSGDAVRGHVTVHENLLQPYGIVHGGVYASLAETAASVGGAAWNMARVPGGRTVGVSNSTHFLRATREGTLTVMATPQHRGRTLQLWQVDITDEQGRLVAKSDVRLANLEPQSQAG